MAEVNGYDDEDEARASSPNRSTRRATRAPRRPKLRAMPELSRTQLAVYAAVAVALLLVGARALRSGGDREAAFADSPARSSENSTRRRGGGETVRDRVAAVRTSSSTSPARSPSRGSTGCRQAPGSTTRSPAPGAPRRGRSLEAINLAARLGDGQQVLVPASTPAARPRRGGVVSEDGPISLGSASVEQLETIDGIGPVTAGDIVEFRDEHGGLSSVDQLDQVPGIGPATMEALRDRLQP